MLSVRITLSSTIAAMTRCCAETSQLAGPLQQLTLAYVAYLYRRAPLGVLSAPATFSSITAARYCAANAVRSDLLLLGASEASPDRAPANADAAASQLADSIAATPACSLHEAIRYSVTHTAVTVLGSSS